MTPSWYQDKKVDRSERARFLAVRDPFRSGRESSHEFKNVHPSMIHSPVIRSPVVAAYRLVGAHAVSQTQGFNVVEISVVGGLQDFLETARRFLEVSVLLQNSMYQKQPLFIGAGSIEFVDAILNIPLLRKDEKRRAKVSATSLAARRLN